MTIGSTLRLSEPKHAGRLAALVEPGGKLIVSGFNTAEAGDVARALGCAIERELATSPSIACT